MPKDPRIKKVLVIGSGPIIIGQAAEFDYSGTQACRALKAEGIETVLLNSNPATIMTDPDVADHVYIEPMTLEVVERILSRPSSLCRFLYCHRFFRSFPLFTAGENAAHVVRRGLFHRRGQAPFHLLVGHRASSPSRMIRIFFNAL